MISLCTFRHFRRRYPNRRDFPERYRANRRFWAEVLRIESGSRRGRNCSVCILGAMEDIVFLEASIVEFESGRRSLDLRVLDSSSFF